MTDTTLYGEGNYVCLAFREEDAQALHQPGPADAFVAELVRTPYMAEQLAALDPSAIRSELQECGAWDATELADDVENEHRLVWVLGCNAAENAFLESEGQA